MKITEHGTDTQGESAEDVIRRLGLVVHPEGGWFREIYRSRVTIGTPPGYPDERCAMTLIQYLLAEGDFSAFHRVRSEEIWFHLEGFPIELVTVSDSPNIRVLAPAWRGGEPLVVVPPGCLQAARPLGAWALAACLVAPGFDFTDFEVLRREGLLLRYPAHRELIERYTRSSI